MSSAQLFPTIEFPVGLSVQIPDDVRDASQPERAEQETQPESAKARSPYQPPAEFAADGLKRMTNPAADRRTILLAELTNIHKRRLELEETLLNLQISEEAKQAEVRVLTDFLESCNCLGELSRAVEPLIKSYTPPSKTSDTMRVSRAMSDEDFSSEDCMRIFEQHPNISLSLTEIIKMAPLHKQAAARKDIPHRTGYLERAGKIQRVGMAIFRYTPKTAEQAKPDVKEAQQATQPAVEQAPPLRSKSVAIDAPPRPRGRPRSIPPSAVGPALSGAISGLPHLSRPVVVPRQTH